MISQLVVALVVAAMALVGCGGSQSVVKNQTCAQALHQAEIKYHSQGLQGPPDVDLIPQCKSH